MPLVTQGDPMAFRRRGNPRPPRFAFEIGNTDFTETRFFGGYMGAELQWVRNQTAIGRILIRPNHPFAERVEQCDYDVVPIRTYHNGIPWDGRVQKTRRYGKPGQEVIEVQLVNNFKWMDRIVGYPQPLLPEWIQIPAQDIMIGNLDFVTKWFVARNAMRLDIPLYVRTPEAGKPDLGAPQFGIREDDPIPSLESLLDIIANLDFVSLFSRMTKLSTLVNGAFASSDRELTINLWKEGDPDPGNIFNTETLGRLQNLLDLSGKNLFYFTNPNNLLNIVNPSSWGRARGTCYIMDTKLKRDRRHLRWTTRGGGINHIDRSHSHPEWASVVVGGTSPDIVNNLIATAANMAIQAILTAIGLPFAGVLVGDLLDNFLFAFNRYTDEQMRLDFKGHAWPETFKNSGSAFSLDSLTAGLEGIDEGMGKDELAIEVYDGGGTGRGMEFGKDDGTGRRYEVGDIMTFDDWGVRMENYASAVTVTDNRSEVLRTKTIIGDADPATAATRQIIGKLRSIVDTANAAAVAT